MERTLKLVVSPFSKRFSSATRAAAANSSDFSVILLTAFAAPESVSACFEAGISALIKKPFGLGELRGAIAAAVANLDNSRRLRQLLMENQDEELAQEQFEEGLAALGAYFREISGLLNSEEFPILPDLPSGPVNPAGFTAA